MFAFPLVLLLTSVLLGPYARAHEHHHHHHHDHEHAIHAHEPEKNERELLYGESGQFATFEEWVSSDEFRTSGARCGTKPAPQKLTQDELAFGQWARANSNIQAQAVTNVNLVWHNIQRNDGTGGVTRQQIVDSVKVLNDAFVPAGYQFVLVKNTTTKNTVFWNAPQDSDAEFQMKSQLREGNCSVLNVYNTAAPNLLGWARFPSDCLRLQAWDGVVINYVSVPGGSATSYNLGDTLVHEVGHWMGLYHTFSGCRDPGDYVLDTPPERNADYVCDLTKDECGDGILDDVTNFMNYGYDACINHFTTGQIERMRSQFSFWRTGRTLPPTPAPTPSPTIACSPGTKLFLLNLKTDDWSEEISWDIWNTCDFTEVFSGNGLEYELNTLYSEQICLDAGQSYAFTIYDAAGDGICCFGGLGFYRIYYDGKELATLTGGTYEYNETTFFGNSCPTPSPTTGVPLYTRPPAPTPSPANANCPIYTQIAQAVTGFVGRARAYLTP